MANDGLLNLERIFDGKFLRIPDYQRGYAWENEQLEDFWEDLENLEDEHKHYTGVLTLEKVTKQKKDENPDWIKDRGAYESDESFYIVDGQQRITTSIILLKVLLDKAKELNKNQQSIDAYYNQLIGLIKFDLVDSLSISELGRIESFLEIKLSGVEISNSKGKPFVKSLKKAD